MSNPGVLKCQQYANALDIKSLEDYKTPKVKNKTSNKTFHIQT